MFKELNPLLHSELRLAIMSILVSVEEAEFSYLKQQTGATAGNLSVQIDKLNKAEYVEVIKTFKGKMPCTICKITPKGLEAFEEYVDALKSYIIFLEFSKCATTATTSPLKSPSTGRYRGGGSTFYLHTPCQHPPCMKLSEHQMKR